MLLQQHLIWWLCCCWPNKLRCCLADWIIGLSDADETIARIITFHQPPTTANQHTFHTPSYRSLSPSLSWCAKELKVIKAQHNNSSINWCASNASSLSLSLVLLLWHYVIRPYIYPITIKFNWMNWRTFYTWRSDNPFVVSLGLNFGKWTSCRERLCVSWHNEKTIASVPQWRSW